MPVIFRCNNILRFDDERQQYLHCDQKLKVADSKIGTFVNCPRCKQAVEVPAVSQEMEPQAVADSSIQASAVVGRDEGPQASGGPTPAMAPESGQLTYSNLVTSEYCPKCGSPLSANRCHGCGFVKQQYENRPPIDRIGVKPAGFYLWLTKKMSGGLSPGQLALACHILVVLSLVVGFLVAVVVGGIAAFVLIFLLAAFGLVYLVAVIQFRRLLRRPAATLTWWQSALWNMTLGFVRGHNWYLSKEESNRVLDLSDKGCSDAELDRITRFKPYRVLDLSNCDVTDQGLYKLHLLVNLRYLILKNTAVTNEGVFRLQQALPNLWIWY